MKSDVKNRYLSSSIATKPTGVSLNKIWGPIRGSVTRYLSLIDTPYYDGVDILLVYNIGNILLYV